MQRDARKELEKIMSEIECTKGFVCFQSELKSLCRAKKFQPYDSLMCLDDEQAQGCSFAVHYAYKYFCKCPIRIYISAHLEKH